MKLLVLVLVVAAAQAQVDPRGARPVVPNTRSEKCATQKDWPFCTDEEWGPKCPSGCRIHGLLEQVDHDFLKRIEKIRSLLEENQIKHRSTDQISKQTHDYLREKLTLGSGLDNNYYDIAQTLRQRITEMKIKIDQQLLVLAALKNRVRDQVQDMQKLEVDIDMKLRACKGSCKTHHGYEMDHEGHVALEKQMHQLDTLSGQRAESVGTLHVMKSRPLQDAVVDSIFKSKDVPTAQQQTTEDLFPGVKTVQLFLEMEGSSSSPATISKVPVCLRLSQNGRQSPRPSDRKQKYCRAKTELPLCSDHDWASRCPSGCRLHGLILEHETKVENKLRYICEKSKTLEDAVEKSMATTARIYHQSRDFIVSTSELQRKFVEGAETLTKNLTSLRKWSKSLETQTVELRGRVQQQLDELLRAEVELGLTLRSCLGSCRSGPSFSAALEDFTTLRSQTEEVGRRAQKPRAAAPGDVPKIHTAPVDFGPEPSPVYKTIRTVLTEGLDLFEDLQQQRLLLEDDPDASELE